MKRFITKIVFLFVLPFSVYLTVKEVALRSVPNDYAYKNQWLTDHAKQVKILSLGSSHGYSCIQPAAFSQTAFNAAHVSQSLLFDKFILEKFVPQMDSLEYVILPISYFTIRHKGLENGQESWRVKNYTIYYNCPYFKYRPRFALECYICAPKRTINTLFYERNHRSCDSLGRGTKYFLETRAEDWESTGPVAMKRHTYKDYKQEDINKNITYIKDIIQTCEAKNIRVVLLTTPTYRSYYELLDEEQLDQMIECCTTLANEHSNTIYLNWLKHPDFDEQDFWDADHLNEFGAIKLTRLLDEELNKN